MKSILLHIHDDDGADSRLQAACDLARACNAHVQCVQVTPMPDLVAADVYGGAGYAPSIAAERARIDSALTDPKKATGAEAKMNTSDLMVKRAAVEKKLAAAEEIWMEAGAALEAG